MTGGWGKKGGHMGKEKRGSPSTLLTRKPPGHADGQQDDRAHQQNGNDRDEAVHPQGNRVCDKQNSVSLGGPPTLPPRLCPVPGYTNGFTLWRLWVQLAFLDWLRDQLGPLVVPWE